jgi:hypothetical protein
MKKTMLVLAATLALTVGGKPAVAGPEKSTVDQINAYAQEGGMGGTVAQVNSVSELTDVDPNSWAFQALKTVVERYGCLEGYPNKTYRGNKPLSRYEFAAGLNACLEKVNELITANTANKVTREDLATLQRLQDEFRNELAALRGRVDALEAKTRDIESKLFNTNAKLDGSVVMAITGGAASSDRVLGVLPQAGVVIPNLGTPQLAVGSPYGDSAFTQAVSTIVARPGAGSNTSFLGRTTLNLRATFSGQDELLIRMRGVTGQDVGAYFSGISNNRGTAFYGLGPGNIPYDQSVPNTGVSQGTNGAALVVFDKIRYTTNLFSDKFRVFFGPRIDLFEFIDTNSFANNEEVDFSSGLHINNQLITFLFNGPGAGFDWQVLDWFAFRGAYIAPTGGSVGGTLLTGAPFGGSGIVGGSYIAVGELEFNPGRTVAIKLQYAHFLEQGRALGTALGPLGTSGVTDAYGGNIEWAITPNIAIFGRFAYGNTRINAVASTTFTNIESNTWQAGFALPNLLGTGNLFAASYAQPIRVTAGQFVTGLGFVPSGTEGNIEAFFRFRINDRLTITPDFQYIFNGANLSGNSGISIGTLRATFTF